MRVIPSPEKTSQLFWRKSKKGVGFPKIGNGPFLASLQIFRSNGISQWDTIPTRKVLVGLARVAQWSLSHRLTREPISYPWNRLKQVFRIIPWESSHQTVAKPRYLVLFPWARLKRWVGTHTCLLRTDAKLVDFDGGCPLNGPRSPGEEKKTRGEKITPRPIHQANSPVNPPISRCTCG